MGALPVGDYQDADPSERMARAQDASASRTRLLWKKDDVMPLWEELAELGTVTAEQFAAAMNAHPWWVAASGYSSHDGAIPLQAAVRLAF